MSKTAGPRSDGQARAAVRRRDRAKEDTWVRSVLKSAPFGFLATVHDGTPFINSNLYVYDEGRHCIYMHTARVGRTRSNLEAHGESGAGAGAPVCFSVATMGRMLPAQEALEFSVEYAGVVVFGSGRVVDDAIEKEYALQLLLDRYAPHLQPGRDYRPITAAELERTAVYRINVEEWSGKQKLVPDSFPGAFDLPGRDDFPWGGDMRPEPDEVPRD